MFAASTHGNSMSQQQNNNHGFRRKNWNKTASTNAGHHNMYDYPAAQQFARAQSTQMYYPAGAHPGSNNQHSANVGGNLSVLTENINRMNLQPNMYHSVPTMKQSPAVASHSFDGGVPLNAGTEQAFMQNGQLVFTNPQFPATAHQTMTQGFGMYPPYMPQPILQYPQHHMLGAQSPMTSTWPPSTRVSSGEVPSLVTPRRGSTSSQENDVPGTPFTQYTGYGVDFPGSVSVLDRSPRSLYNPAWSTPSPTVQANFASKHQQKNSLDHRLHLLIQQDPAIPRAVPAPYSPVKPLNRSLENPHGITNVYIRGLLPETTDEMLFKLACRFGDIVSSKSIIDHVTGLCKGFGFVKFHNFRDAEDCIRGFHFLGYESSFARESFYSQLKKLHDDDNTNLYVSNLPKDMNEHELSAIFGRYKVCSSRILRDNAGNGRGVGFARFESRQICEEIIKDYNNTPIRKGSDGEEHLIQIRFADTPDQKHLKQQTAAARTYRTAEYESQTQGRSPLVSPARGPGVRDAAQPTDHDFESYLSMTTGRGSGYQGQNGTPAHDHLSTVSSPRSTPVGSVINVSLPAFVSPEQCALETRASGEYVVSSDDDTMRAVLKIEGSPMKTVDDAYLSTTQGHTDLRWQ